MVLFQIDRRRRPSTEETVDERQWGRISCASTTGRLPQPSIQGK